MGINGVGSYHTQDYAIQNRNRSVGRNSSISDDESIGNATSLSESSGNGKRIGITTVGNVGYIAMYADSSTEQDPIVKVGDYEVRVKDGKEYLTYFTKDTIVCQSTESSNEVVWTMEITEEQSELINKYFERCQAEQDGETSWYSSADLGMVSSKEYWLGFFEGAEVSDDFIDFAPNAPDEVREAFMNAAEEAVDYAKFLEEKINEIFVKIQNGDTEATYQIGAQSFTEKEWEEFLDKFDSVEEAIQELMKEEQARKEAEEDKKEGMVTNDASALLTTESTSCVYETADPEDDDLRYITWYTGEGIFCRKAGQTEGYEWTITFENKEQYDKVMEFIGQFPSDWNMRFAAHENFWNDFLNDEIDMEGFMEFINGTNKGIPDFSVTVGESMYVDKDKVQWAKYTNPLGTRFYTAEEMYQMKAELIEKNTANAHKLSDPYSILYKKLHPEYNGERIFCEYPGGPLYTADEIMEIMNRNLKDAKYQAEARK